MKKLILILLAISPFCLKAQTTGMPPEPLFIVDGKEVTKAAAFAIDPITAIDTKPMKGPEATALYGSKAAGGALIIVTKKYAVASYQEKLSQLCDSYESYLTGHGTEDDTIAYDLDGKTLPKDNTGIAILYKLPKEKIADAVFTEKEPESSKFAVRIVITTKK
jgi:hypothetical protein